MGSGSRFVQMTWSVAVGCRKCLESESQSHMLKELSAQFTIAISRNAPRDDYDTSRTEGSRTLPLPG